MSRGQRLPYKHKWEPLPLIFSFGNAGQILILVCCACLSKCAASKRAHEARAGLVCAAARAWVEGIIWRGARMNSRDAGAYLSISSYLSGESN